MTAKLCAITFLTLSISLISCAAAPGAFRPDSASIPAPMPPPAFAPAAPTAAAQRAAAPADQGGAVPQAASVERMIVYNVNVNLEVQDTEKAVNDISNIVAQFKGYIVASNLSRNAKGQMQGTITLRVPAESLDSAQKQLEAVGLKVLSRNRNSNDVTDQYTDLGARLKNLQATEDELRKMMDNVREKSNKAEDILAVYRELTNIRTQIEQIKGQMNVLDKTSSFATLTVQLTPHEEVQIVEPETWVPNRTAAQALRALIQALQGLTDLAIWLALFVLPILIVLVLPLLLLAWLLRFAFRRRAKAKAPTPA